MLAVVVPRVVVVVVVLEVVDVVVGKKVLFECVDVDVITVVAGGVVVGATAGVLTLPPSSSRSLPGTRTMYRYRSVITRNSFPGYSSFRYLALKSPKGVIASQKYCGTAVRLMFSPRENKYTWVGWGSNRMFSVASNANTPAGRARHCGVSSIADVRAIMQ